MQSLMKNACLVLAALTLTACGGSTSDSAFSPAENVDAPVVATSIHNLEAPRNFDYSTHETVPVEITLKNADGSADASRLVVLHTVVGEETGSPVPGFSVGAGLTDADGVWVGEVNMPAFDRKVFVQTPTANYQLTQLVPNGQGMFVLSLTHP